MSLKKRFTLIFSVLGILILASLGLNMITSSVQEEVQAAHKNKFLSYVVAKEFSFVSSSLTKNCQTYVSTGGEQKYYVEYLGLIDWSGGKTPRPDYVHSELKRGETVKQLDIMKELGFSENEFGLLSKAASFSAALIATETQAMESVSQGKFVEGPFKMKKGETVNSFAQRIVFDDNYWAEVSKIMEPVNEFFEELETRTSDNVSTLTAKANMFTTITTIFQILVIAALVFFIYYLMIMVFNPISTIVSVISKMIKDIKAEQGDLSLRVDVNTKDEMGELAKSFNDFVAIVQQIIGQIQKTTTTVANASEELTSVSSEMQTGAQGAFDQSLSVASATEEMSTNITTMASAAEEMSVNANEVAGAAEQTSQNMNAVASAVEEMSVSIDQIAQDTGTARDVANEASTSSQKATIAMGTLSEAAKEIGNVTEVIKRIAEQTNLLALNATIEAASAGEAGKGFAVVANEIKELANQSAKAADDIATRIAGVQNNTDEAVSVIEGVAAVIGEIGTTVNNIAQSVDQQSAAVTNISANVSQANTGVKNIAGAIAEVAKGANDVSRNSVEASTGANTVSSDIVSIKEASEGAVNGSNQVNSSANELAQMAGDLKGIVAKFKQ
jgi:methyl-accepting chemotaxis protein